MMLGILTRQLAALLWRVSRDAAHNAKRVLPEPRLDVLPACVENPCALGISGPFALEGHRGHEDARSGQQDGQERQRVRQELPLIRVSHNSLFLALRLGSRQAYA